MPAWDAAIHTPRNIFYKNGGESLVDYQGRGIARHDRATGGFRIEGLDEDVLYEGAYFFCFRSAVNF